MFEFVLRTLYPSEASRSTIHLVTSLSSIPVSSSTIRYHTIILAASLLPPSLQSFMNIPIDSKSGEQLTIQFAHCILLMDAHEKRNSLSSSLLAELLHLSYASEADDQLFQQALMSLSPSPTPTPSRSTRQGAKEVKEEMKELAKGGEAVLPVEHHVLSLCSWQTNLRDVLLDAVEMKLDDHLSASSVLQAFYSVFHYVEEGIDAWTTSHSCVLPPRTIAWPMWLWSILVPSPYQTILTSNYNIFNYTTTTLRKQEYQLLVAKDPSSLVFYHSCSVYQPLISLKADQFESAYNPVMNNLLLSSSQYQYYQQLFAVTEEPVITETPCLTGKTKHYRWIANTMNDVVCEAYRSLSPLVPSKTHASPITLSNPKIEY